MYNLPYFETSRKALCMKKQFSTKVKTVQVVQIENNGVFTHGGSDPTQLEISVLDTKGSLHVLVFKGETLSHLAGIIGGLMDVFPDVFGSRAPQQSC